MRVPLSPVWPVNLWVPRIRFALDRRSHTVCTGIEQDPRMVMSFCYWILRRLLELIVLRGRREVANEI